MRRVVCLLLLSIIALSAGAQSRSEATPGSRSVMDAHNCYPYYEWWYDRIDRALSAGTPLAIEQDLYWYTDPKTGKSWSVVAHGAPVSGHEPTMEHYFFDRVRPTVEQALKEGNRGQWPLITLNLDLKTEEPAHLHAIWALLSKYQDWITTAPKTSDPNAVQPLTVRPILVLTGESDAQQAVFYDEVPVGGRLLVFGAAHTDTRNPMASPDVLELSPATNYRRWWNNPWRVVEEGGQQTRAHGPPKTMHGFGRWCATRMRTICGFAFIPSTARRRRKRAATAGSTAITSARSRQLKNAGAQHSRREWTTLRATSTSFLARCCETAGNRRSPRFLCAGEHSSQVCLNRSPLPAEIFSLRRSVPLPPVVRSAKENHFCMGSQSGISAHLNKRETWAMPNHVIRFLIWIGVVVILAAVAVFYLFYAPGREPIQSNHPGASVMLRLPDTPGPRWG